MDYTKARTLLRELKNSKFIPYYNENLINEIVQDHQKFVKEIMKEKKNYNEEKSKDKSEHYKSPYVLTLLNILNRIFRIILAYLNHRIVKIRETFWKNGGRIPKEQQEFLSKEERVFVGQYKKLNEKYQQSFPIPIDLSKDLTPPESLFIEIRVVEECGTIISADGSEIDLSRGATLFVKKSDVEEYLRRGMVVETS